MTDMKVSVIVPTYNRIERLKLCLAALLRQTFAKQNYEIIVTDDGSTDGTKEYLADMQDRKEIAYLWHRNVGTAGNRNIGIQKAQGDIILFIDDDVEATADLVARHAELHTRMKNESLVILGYTPFAASSPRSPAMSYRKKNWDSIYTRAAAWPDDKKFQLVITNNLSISRAFLTRAGGFDESFHNATHEDTELGYRLMRMGMAFMFCPEALAFHHYFITESGSFLKERQRGEAQVFFDKRHPETGTELSLDILNPPRSLKITVILWRSCKWVLYNKTTIGLLVRVCRYLSSTSRITFLLMGVIHWYYYILGVKDGIGSLLAGKSPVSGKTAR